MAFRRWLKLLSPVIASIAGLVTLRLVGPGVVDQHRLSGWLRPLGEWAPLAFISCLAVRPLTLLPGQAFTAVGGLVFGTRAAITYALLGHFLGSTVTFWVGRWFGRAPLRRFAGSKFQAVEQASRRHGFGFACLLCLNPLLPTDAALAAVAASGARFWPTVLGVLIGSVPGTVATAAFGSSLGQGRAVATALAAMGMVLSLLLGAALGRKVVREITAEPRPPRRPLPLGSPTAPTRPSSALAG